MMEEKKNVSLQKVDYYLCTKVYRNQAQRFWRFVTVTSGLNSPWYSRTLCQKISIEHVKC